MDVYSPSGGLDISTFPSEVWMPLLAYLELDDVFNLVLCGSSRTNRRISESVRSASLTYRGGVRIVWPGILSQFSALESITLQPVADNSIFNLGYRALQALPSTLKTLQVRILIRRGLPFAPPSEANSTFPHDKIDIAQQCPNLQTVEFAEVATPNLGRFVSSLARLTSLTSLTLPILLPKHLESLPDCLTYLKLGNIPKFEREESAKFPSSLQFFELPYHTPPKLMSYLPQSLHTLRTDTDPVALLKDLTVLPKSLTHLHFFQCFESEPIELASFPPLVFPANLRYLALSFFLQARIVSQLPKTLDTLLFQSIRGDGVQWSHLPPNLTECPLLKNDLPYYASLPRNLKRFTDIMDSTLPFPALAVDTHTDLRGLPQSLETLELKVSSQAAKGQPNYYLPLNLPPAITKLIINTRMELESHSGADLIEVINSSLPNLTYLSCLGPLPIDALTGLKRPLEYFQLANHHYEDTALLQLREKSASGDERTSLASPSMPLLPWCASLKALDYKYKTTIDLAWMKTLPSTLETLVLSESDSNVPLPFSSILHSLPPRITHLSVSVAEILPEDLSHLPATLRELTILCPSGWASYSVGELLSLPRHLLKLTITKSNLDLQYSFESDFKMTRRFCRLKWAAVSTVIAL